MRKLVALFLIYCSNANAVAPLGIAGQDQAVFYPSVIKVPSNQTTDLGGIDGRIETGNTNLLVNPSFEHKTTNFGWTLTNATAAVTTTDFTDGKKGLTVTPTSAGGGIKQTSTLYAAKIVGGQAIAKISVKTTGTDVKVCPLINGSRPTDTTKYCASVPSTNTSVVFPEAIVPFILDGTSNGIEVYSVGTSVFTIDEGFVGKFAPIQGVNGAKLMGTVTITGCSLVWSTTSTTFVDFAAQAGCTYTTTGQALAPSTNIPAIKFTSMPAGDYRLEFEGRGESSNSGVVASYQFSDGSNTARETSSIDGSASSVTLNGISQSISYSTNQSNTTLSIKSKVSSGTGFLYGTSAQPAVIKVWYFPPESRIYSQASQDYAYTNAGSITIGATTTAPTKGTIVTDRIMASRKGQNLIAEYQYAQSTSGTNGVGDYLFTLPSGLSFDSNIIGFYTGAAPSNTASGNLEKAIVGFGKVAGDTTPYYMSTLIAYSATQFRVLNNYASGGNAFVGSALTSLGFANAVFNFRLQAPISGWQDYGVIVGSFAGLEKCDSAGYECTDTFSAQVSNTGVVSNENLDWINGNFVVSPTGTFTGTLNTNLKDGTNGLSSALNCAASVTNDDDYTLRISSSTTTSIVVKGDLAQTSTSPRDIGFSIKCQKGTNDYKPKTAKIASSIGVPTVPNAGTSVIDTFSINFGTTNATTICTVSPCSYLDQIGSAVTSVTRSSTGNYSLNVAKTYSKLKCVGNFMNPALLVGSDNQSMSCASCSTLPISTYSTSAGALQDVYGILYCQGSY